MYNQREIVLVPFPYTDLSNTKRRPVLIVSGNDYNHRHNDVIVAVISSNLSYKDDYSVSLEDKDLEIGILPESSVIKVHKLFTISKSRIIKKFSLIRKEKFKAVFKILTKLFEIN
ncbi:MAG: type II toxin-antitoxin system PemK/MazF family toxin [Actinomycetota bacterium]|nr:type II toxin-antitoxin system PemK/MazF family toxin [Actinomycetota bacterium]